MGLLGMCGHGRAGLPLRLQSKRLPPPFRRGQRPVRLAWSRGNALWVRPCRSPLRDGEGKRARSALRGEARISGIAVTHRSPASAMRAASSSAPAFISVSWYSASGSESATMPPPAWKCTVLPFTTMVRRVMQVSMAPEKLK